MIQAVVESMASKSFPSLIICEQCERVYPIRAVAHGQKTVCERCGTTLQRGSMFSISAWLALTVTAGVLFIFANVFPVAVISFGGLQSEATIWQSVLALATGPGAPVAIAAAIVTMVVPAIQIATLTWVLAFSLRHRTCPCFIAAMRVLRVTRPWSMTEVWLLGIIVAIVKLSGYLHVIVGVGVWATVLLAPTMTIITHRGYSELWHVFERAK